MLSGDVDPGDATSPAALRDAYEGVLVETIERVGVDTVRERSGVARETLEALENGESPELTVTEAAAVLAADETRPDSEAIAAEARDALLMGMTTAVVDVDTLASELGGDLGPTELQQKVEGRHPMSLAEFAAVRHVLAERKA